MTDIAGDPAPARPGSGLVDRIPTGAKIFLILSAALLPLAIIAFFATLRTAELADEATQAQLRVTTTESARKLAIELVGDMTALRVSLNALEADPGDAPSCARAQGVFAPQIAAGTRFMIMDARSRLICGEQLPVAPWPTAAGAEKTIAARIYPGRGLTLATTSASGRTRAAAFFPVDVLAATAAPSGYAMPYEARLVLGTDALILSDLPRQAPLERRAGLSMGIGLGEIALTTRMRSAPITSPVLVSLILPIIMWAAAAGIGWFVVDRLLIRSLRQLRSRVANFVPGEEIDPGAMHALPAQEIRELGETFRAISRTVARYRTQMCKR